ncbi:MAG: hypothetical protein GY870_15150 [archaeon]|nr:hypothetical protein [archaeon]
MKKDLEDFLVTATAWEKMSTPMDSVFVVKVPGPKANREGGSRLMIEVNPVDEAGKPKKRKGLFIADSEMYNQFVEALAEDGIIKLLNTIQSINPVKKSGKLRKLKME